MSASPKFLNITYEKYPTFRVDLTELLSKGLTARGYKIDWHMQSHNESRSRLVDLSDNERVFLGASGPGKSVIDKVMNRIRAVVHELRIFKIVRGNDYDFVQVRDKPFAALFALMACRLNSVPFFYWMSYPYPESDIFMSRDKEIYLPVYLRFLYLVRGVFTGWLLYKIVLSGADHVFVQSDRMLDDVMHKGIASSEMTPVPMGVSLFQLGNLKFPVIEDVPDGRIPLVYVGTMIRVRRIDFLIEMMKLVKEHVPEAILLLVGDAPESDMNYLRNMAAQLEVEDSVIFTGFVPMEKAWAYIKKSKVCLSPFRPSPILDSTSPTKIVEYMAMGRPVVANTHPDQSKVLCESGAGFAVDYTPQAFSDAVVKILGDTELANDMGCSGIDYVRKHRSYEALSDSLDDKYRELLVNK